MSGEGLLNDYQAQQEARRREVQALSPELRRDLERLCVVASGPDTHGGITESRGREILGCSVSEFRTLILEHDPPEVVPAAAEAAEAELERLRDGERQLREYFTALAECDHHESAQDAYRHAAEMVAAAPARPAAAAAEAGAEGGEP